MREEHRSLLKHSSTLWFAVFSSNLALRKPRRTCFIAYSILSTPFPQICSRKSLKECTVLSFPLRVKLGQEMPIFSPRASTAHSRPDSKNARCGYECQCPAITDESPRFRQSGRMGNHVQTGATFQARASGDATSEKCRHDLHLTGEQSRVHLAFCLFDRHSHIDSQPKICSMRTPCVSILRSSMALYDISVRSSSDVHRPGI